MSHPAAKQPKIESQSLNVGQPQLPQHAGQQLPPPAQALHLAPQGHPTQIMGAPTQVMAVGVPQPAPAVKPAASVVPTTSATTASVPSAVVRQLPRQSNPYAHNITRTSPATVIWLHENFEACEDRSLGREPLYNHYCEHCKSLNQEPVNQASFGKLIRSVFPDLKTRRLGTRGNSKYHYYGVKLKGSCNLFFDETQIGGAHHKYRGKGPSKKSKSEKTSASAKDLDAPTAASWADCIDTKATLPPFPTLTAKGFTAEEDFCTPYHAHCKQVLKAVYQGNFSSLPDVFNQFWGTIAKHFSEVLASQSARDTVLLCDDLFLATLLKVLMPDVLKPLPEEMIRQIRNFAKNVVSWIKTAVSGFDEAFVKAKCANFSKMAKLVRRFTSLNHLFKAVKVVVTDQRIVRDMCQDLKAVDFSAVHSQCHMSTRCPGQAVHAMFGQFLQNLEQAVPLKQWTDWLCEMLLKSITDPAQCIPQSKQFLLKWSAYSSIVIRDLTVRSAPTFGHFHLCQLAFDEFLLFVTERISDLGWVTSEHLHLITGPAHDLDRVLGLVQSHIPGPGASQGQQAIYPPYPQLTHL
eukprot:m.116316 g.116316  ORF g.116316 m.116316 type:complete len:576 (+) comp13604_c0_seq1:243-1970(+)